MDPVVDVSSLYREIPLGFTEADCAALEAELRPHTDALVLHLGSGETIASHLAGTASVCVPITDITDPHELYREATGTVSGERFECREYPDYWVTTHHSEVPVVLLLLKRSPPPPSTLHRLCRACSDALGAQVGGTCYLQWNMPGFGWKLHTDDEYEGVRSRVHVPLRTTPENLFAWAPRTDSREDEWVLAVHLKRGGVYVVRTDVPHTAVNRHPSEGRLHLIMDVAS
jgi:hypothetical protein